MTNSACQEDIIALLGACNKSNTNTKQKQCCKSREGICGGLRRSEDVQVNLTVLTCNAMPPWVVLLVSRAHALMCFVRHGQAGQHYTEASSSGPDGMRKA